MNEAPDLLAGRLVRLRRALGKQMHAAVDVGVVLPVMTGDGVDHGARLLGGGRAVEIDQRPAPHRLRKDGEVTADVHQNTDPRQPEGAASSTSSST